MADHLFRNDGGRFVDVTNQAGINDWHGQGLGVVAIDLDSDGRLDLFVANDQSLNYLFHNLGNMKFEEVAESSGLACNANGGLQANMGVACGDLDGDGRPDLGVTTFYNESMTFYHNLGGGIFADHTAAIGLEVPTRYKLGFGTEFLDVNNDGYLDVAIANGHVDDFRPEIPYAMPAQLLVGSAGGKLTEVSDRAGSPWQVPRVGRGLARGDLDNDGRARPPPARAGRAACLLSQPHQRRPLSDRCPPGHSLESRRRGRQGDGYAGGRSRVAWRYGGGSYQSASDPRLHFGLGEAARVESIEVKWPSGRVDRYGPLAADTGYLLREGQAGALPLAGFRGTSADH